MSAVSTRPRIRTISYTAPLVEAVDASGAAFVTPALLTRVIGHPQLDVRATSCAAAETGPRLVDTAQLVQQIERLPVSQEGVDVGRARQAFLDTVANAGFAAQVEQISGPLHMVGQATTIPELAMAATTLVEALAAGNSAAVATVTANACLLASRAAGFSDVEIQRAGADGRIRVLAFNESGQALVSELRAEDRGVALRTEVIGVTDGGCERILDRFDDVLGDLGVAGDAVRTRHARAGESRTTSQRRRIAPVVSKVRS